MSTPTPATERESRLSEAELTEWRRRLTALRQAYASHQVGQAVTLWREDVDHLFAALDAAEAARDALREEKRELQAMVASAAGTVHALRAELAGAKRTIASLQWPDGGPQPHPLQSCAKCGLGGGHRCMADDCPQVVRVGSVDPLGGE